MRCPECNRSIDVYEGANPLKAGTGWCDEHGRVRPTVDAVAAAELTSEEQASVSSGDDQGGAEEASSPPPAPRRRRSETNE